MSKELARIKELNNRLDKVMYFTALLTRELDKYAIIPVIVGGGALEFYTQGSYMTLDIDLVVPGRDKAKRVLEEMGFRRATGEKSWYNDELELSVEIPGDTLAGSMERIVTVEVEEGLTAFVIGVEDLIIDRLNAYKWWNSLNDGQWAVAIMYIHYDNVDFDYLKKRAKEEAISDVIKETIGKTKKLRAEKNRKD